MAAAVAGWQYDKEFEIDYISPDYLSPQHVSEILGRTAEFDLRQGDEDWRTPDDLLPQAERPEHHPENTFGIHDLRHTAATLAIEAGIAPHYVQAILDHHSAQFTLERYVDTTSDGHRAVAGALDF